MGVFRGVATYRPMDISCLLHVDSSGYERCRQAGHVLAHDIHSASEYPHFPTGLPMFIHEPSPLDFGYEDLR